MNYQERIQKIQAEIKSIKNMLREPNDELSKLHGEIINSQGVSDEEFREAFKAWKTLPNSTCMNIWDGEYTLKAIFNKYSLSEFVNKYKEYKQKKEIKVGDEVCKQGSDVKYIVTAIDKTLVGNTAFQCMSEYGLSYSILNTEQLIKTGKHYDIESILNQLKE